MCLPGKVYGQRSLMGYCPWGCKESDILSDWACMCKYIKYLCKKSIKFKPFWGISDSVNSFPLYSVVIRQLSYIQHIPYIPTICRNDYPTCVLPSESESPTLIALESIMKNKSVAFKYITGKMWRKNKTSLGELILFSSSKWGNLDSVLDPRFS